MSQDRWMQVIGHSLKESQIPHLPHLVGGGVPGIQPMKMIHALVFVQLLAGREEWIKKDTVTSGEEGMLTAASPEVVKELPPYLCI